MNPLYQKLLNKSIKILNWNKTPEKLFEKNLKNQLYSWFPNSDSNIVENCINKQLQNKRGNEKAIIYESPFNNESGFYTYKQLNNKINKYCNLLKKHGISKNDKIIIYMPNIPESAMLKLSLAKMRVVYHSIPIGIGANELNKRIKQINPNLVLTSSSGFESSNIIDLMGNLNKIYSEKGDIKTLVLQRDMKKSKLDKDKNIYDIENELEKIDNREFNFENDNENKNLYLFLNEKNNQFLYRDHTGYSLSTYLTMQRDLGTIEDDVIFCTNSLSSSYGQTYSLYGPLLKGASTLILEGQLDDSKHYWNLIKKHEVNILLGKENLIDNILENKELNKEIEEFNFLKTIVYNDLENIFEKKNEIENTHICKMIFKNEIGYPIISNSFINNSNDLKINYGIDYTINKDNLFLKAPYFPSLFIDTLDNKLSYYDKYFNNDLYDVELKLKLDENENITEIINDEIDYYQNSSLKIDIQNIEIELNKEDNIDQSFVMIEDELEEKEKIIIFLEVKDKSLLDTKYYEYLRNKLINQFGSLLKIDFFIPLNKIPLKNNNKPDKDLLENLFYKKEDKIEDKYKFYLDEIHNN